MTVTDEEALEAEAAGRDVEFRRALIRRHPLWAGGRARLIADLEKAGKGREAMPLFLELVALRMTAEICREAATFAAKYGDRTTYASCVRLDAELSGRRSDRATVLRYLRLAEGCDALLRKLYKDKIHELSNKDTSIKDIDKLIVFSEN
jgi:hypothetical protein